MPRKLVRNQCATMEDEYEILLKNRIKSFVTNLHKMFSSTGSRLIKSEFKKLY